MLFRKRQIVGIDVGTSCAKAVVVDYGDKADKLFVREYAVLPLEQDQPLEETLRRLLRKLRTRSRECAVSAWPSGARLRLFDSESEQLTSRLRAGRKVDSSVLFHEKLDDYVTEYGPVESFRGGSDTSMAVACGIPRSELLAIEGALRKLRYKLRLLQLTPIAILNAFIESHPEVVRRKPFVLVDFGRTRTTVIGGSRGTVRVMRVIENPWGDVPPPLDSADGEENIPDGVSEVAAAMTEEILPVCEYLRSLDENVTIQNIYTTGALSNHSELVRSLSLSLDLTCVQWNPLRQAIARERAMKDFMLLKDLVNLPAAAGAAFQCVR